MAYANTLLILLIGNVFFDDTLDDKRAPKNLEGILESNNLVLSGEQSLHIKPLVGNKLEKVESLCCYHD